MHRNAPLTVEGRLRLCRRIAAGWTVAETCRQMQVSRQTGHKWWRRYQADGEAGLTDRSSRPHCSPAQTPPEVEDAVLAARQQHRAGAVRLAGIMDLPVSTVRAVLVRRRCPHLADIDLVTGEPLRGPDAVRPTVARIEVDRPGELVHIDVKKLARVPDGGGHRVHGRAGTDNGSMGKKGLGFDFVHCAVDGHSRLAYAEVLSAENTVDAVAFLGRAHAWFAERGVQIERVLTDNGNGYRSRAWASLCDQLDITHTRTRPRRPQTNGKVERFNRTLAREWAYRQVWLSNQERNDALTEWLHDYNHHRNHTAIGSPPASRVNNLPAHNI